MKFILDQIDVFVACTDTGSFSAAARRLRRAQSSVSETIATLELNLGITLFDRSTRSPTLTEAGVTLLRESRDLLDQALTVENHVDSLAQGNPAKFSIAIDIPYPLLMDPIKDFASRYPHIDLELRNPSEGSLPKFILDGHAAMGISFAQPDYHRELAFTVLGEFVVCYVVHLDHPFGGAGESVSGRPTGLPALGPHQAFPSSADNGISSVGSDLARGRLHRPRSMVRKRLGLGDDSAPAHPRSTRVR